MSKKFTCWCGVKNPFFASEGEGLESSCGGTGSLNCFCGGDFCVCHHHGESECFGCPDCDDDYEDEDEDDWHDQDYIP